MPEQKLRQLSARLDKLIAYCQQLDEDNKLLRQREQEWLCERTRLVEKNVRVRSRVEEMIARLKELKEGEQ